MERKIQNTFLDDDDYIYIVDNNNVIYMYDDTEFYPFSEPIKNIKKCFRINHKFFIHHDTTITVFDATLYKRHLDEDPWIATNINQVCYSSDPVRIITLENGELIAYFDVTDGSNETEVTGISLSQPLKYSGNIIYPQQYEKYIDIKIIDKLLLAYNGENMVVFSLGEVDSDILRIATLKIKKENYDQIFAYESDRKIFVLSNGNKLSLTGSLYVQNNTIDKIIDNDIFEKQGCFFMVDNSILLCYYTKSKYDTIIKPLISILPIIECVPKVHSQVFLKDDELITFILPDGIDLSIISNNNMQIVIYNNSPHIIDEIFHEILLKDESIYYSTIIDYSDDKDDTALIIDIDITRNIIDQMIHIIPAIYRLNNEMLYNFEQINSDGSVQSYGDGVTRYVFNTLRKELDKILEKKFLGYDLDTCFKLGKLLYFCSKDGRETFSNIHPYFFCCLSKENDYLSLLKLKGSDYPLYLSQYKEFSANPDLLEELDLGLSTAKDYIEYQFSCDLTPEEISCYDSFIKGFLFFAERHKLYSLIKKLSIHYYIDMLIADGFFNAELEYSMKNETINKESFGIFCSIFKRLFGQLSIKEQTIFLQNITGSEYFNGTVDIVYGYEEQEIITRQLIFDENIIDEDDIELFNNVIINLPVDSESKNLSYQISTCHTQLIINTKPTEENINAILQALIIEDNNMKN